MVGQGDKRDSVPRKVVKRSSGRGGPKSSLSTLLVIAPLVDVPSTAPVIPHFGSCTSLEM